MDNGLIAWIPERFSLQLIVLLYTTVTNLNDVKNIKTTNNWK